jgi:5'-nucleotidase
MEITKRINRFVVFIGQVAGMYRILLTNDDGIDSPGLWAAAVALAGLGQVYVVAPREQSSGAGRSLPAASDGRIEPRTVAVNGEAWTVYAIGGTPAQAVLHGMLEIMPQPPHLVVAGINYGENVGTSITSSGTIGAALEAAASGIAALAVSLETAQENHRTHSRTVDFTTAAHFTALFARWLLANRLPAGVDLLKVDVPASATPQTAWRITRLSRQRYYEPLPPRRTSWAEAAPLDYCTRPNLDCEPDSDVYVLRVERLVAVTPLSLDFTARVSLEELEHLLRA